ncbi:hypothetical protein AMTRI_Chr04g243040 [Amborella trichopoda]
MPSHLFTLSLSVHIPSILILLLSSYTHDDDHHHSVLSIQNFMNLFTFSIPSSSAFGLKCKENGLSLTLLLIENCGSSQLEHYH